VQEREVGAAGVIRGGDCATARFCHKPLRQNITHARHSARRAHRALQASSMRLADARLSDCVLVASMLLCACCCDDASL